LVWKRRQEKEANCCTLIDKVKIKEIKLVRIDAMKENGGVEV
jgi:hypothetical protein